MYDFKKNKKCCLFHVLVICLFSECFLVYLAMSCEPLPVFVGLISICFQNCSCIQEKEKLDAFKIMGLGSFSWIWDNACPTQGDMKAGKNMDGFKGKATLLWPYNKQGKHDPQHKNVWMVKVAAGIGKALKTTPVDSYLMTDDDVASHIESCFQAAPK